jgi:hypothetical protein
MQVIFYSYFKSLLDKMLKKRTEIYSNRARIIVLEKIMGCHLRDSFLQ